MAAYNKAVCKKERKMNEKEYYIYIYIYKKKQEVKKTHTRSHKCVRANE